LTCLSKFVPVQFVHIRYLAFSLAIKQEKQEERSNPGVDFRAPICPLPLVKTGMAPACPMACLHLAFSTPRMSCMISSKKCVNNISFKVINFLQLAPG